jgi:hypothetical protein
MLLVEFSGPAGFGQRNSQGGSGQYCLELANGLPHDRSVQPPPDLVDPPGPVPPGCHSYQPKTVGPAFIGVIRIRQRRCLIMAAR